MQILCVVQSYLTVSIYLQMRNFNDFQAQRGKYLTHGYNKLMWVWWSNDTSFFKYNINK